MQETIILAPGINGDELLRSMALHGKNSFNTRIMGASELARLALTRAGITLSEGFLSIAEENLLIGAAVRDCPYFKSASLKDTVDIANTLRTARGLIAAENESEELHRILEKGLFPEKNEALLQVYDRYILACEESHAIDRILLLRKAAALCTLSGARCLVLENAELSPLELLLLEKLSGGMYEKITLQQLYGVKSGSPVSIQRYSNCFGTSNEAECIVEAAYAAKQLDSMTVAVTDPGEYSRIFWNLAVSKNIPMTFGCGVPILNSNPAKLLDYYTHWMTDGFFSAESLHDMLSADCFNGGSFLEGAPVLPESVKPHIFKELLGNLRLTNNEALNRTAIDSFEASLQGEPEGEKDRGATRQDKLLSLPLLRYYGKQLALPAWDFIYNYSRIRKNSETLGDLLCLKLDLAAQREIRARLQVYGEEIPSEELVEEILSLMIMRQSSAAGALHITDVSHVSAAIRPHVHFAGLAASMFPGSPRENYLLLDSDLALFGAAGDTKNSFARVQRKREQLLHAVQLAADLGSVLTVSYPGMNISDLKLNNASSVLFDLYRLSCGKDVSVEELEKNVDKVGYFQPRISDACSLGEAYLEGKKLTINTAEPVEPYPAFLKELLSQPFSPSAIDNYKGCPFQFFLGRVLHLPDNREREPLAFWTPAECGTVAHNVMECFANSRMDKAAFLRLAEEFFDRFADQNRPVLQATISQEKADFLEMMENAFDMDPRRKVRMSEQKLTYVHERSGICLTGYPDRVEELPDGSVAVVDFKTGRTVKHDDDDPNTCMQTMLYAYLLEQVEGARVSYGEYRYFRSQRSIRCDYDDTAKEAMDEYLCSFRDGLEQGDFTPNPSDDDTEPCKYCSFKSLCPAKQGNNTDEEE